MLDIVNSKGIKKGWNITSEREKRGDDHDSSAQNFALMGGIKNR